MSIRLRLSLIYTGVLIGVFFLFGIAVYARARAALLDEFDSRLDEVAQMVVDESEAFTLGQETIINFPDELGVFQSAATFMVAVDLDGNLIASSSNIRDYDEPIDPDGMRGETHYSIVSHENQSLRVLTAPLVADNDGQRRLLGYLQVARVMQGYDATLSNLRWTLLFAGWAAVCLSLFLEDLLTQNSLRPLYDITNLAAHITRADDLSRRLPETGRKDEIGRLATVFNSTLERLERLFRAQQRLLADVSHELRTPLTTIRGNVDLMRRMGNADHESLDAIEDETERMTRLVNDLLLLARAEAGGLPIERQRTSLDTIVGEVFRQVHRLADDVHVTIDHFEQVDVLGDPDRLKQLVFNLVNNAVKYTPAGGQVAIRLSRHEDRAILVVEDTGRGIPASDLPYIFERFYRVDKARARPNGGTGLGLAIAKWIVDAHGGEIHVASKVGQGTAFTISLPAIVDEAPTPATAPTRPARSGALQILRSRR